MRYFNYLLISLSSALAAAYAALWLHNPAPLETTTLPPFTIKQSESELLIWVGWRTVEGYATPGINAVEIRCSRERNTCSEAYASIRHHTEGKDLEAQVFDYKISSWTEQRIEAAAHSATGDCLDRKLTVQLAEQTATLQWTPIEGCEGDMGSAALVGDPI